MLENKIILLGGMPACGKTTTGKAIAKALKLPYLDKDTLCDMYTNYVVAKDSFPNDRSSDLYTKTLRNLEYEILFHVALEQVSLDLCPILVAPFTTEFQDKAKMKDLEHKVKNINPKYEVVSILLEGCPLVVKSQMMKRNRLEDQKKLAHWDEYIADKMLTQEKSKKVVSLNFLADNRQTLVNEIVDKLKSL